jgi:hypothetical protein
MQMTYRRDGDGDIREKQFDEVVDLRNTIGTLEITGDKNSLGLKALDWVTPGSVYQGQKHCKGGPTWL